MRAALATQDRTVSSAGNDREDPLAVLERRLDGLFGAGPRRRAVRVLEVGCGDGRVSAAMARRLRRANRHPGSRLLTLDLHLANAAAAARRFAAPEALGLGIRLLVADLYRLPLPAARFDYVIALNVCYQIERRRFFAEAARVLRPDGRLFAYDLLPTGAVATRPLAVFTLRRDQLHGS